MAQCLHKDSHPDLRTLDSDPPTSQTTTRPMTRTTTIPNPTFSMGFRIRRLKRERGSTKTSETSSWTLTETPSVGKTWRSTNPNKRRRLWKESETMVEAIVETTTAKEEAIEAPSRAEGLEDIEEMKEEEDVSSERRHELLPLSIHQQRVIVWFVLKRNFGWLCWIQSPNNEHVGQCKTM